MSIPKVDPVTGCVEFFLTKEEKEQKDLKIQVKQQNKEIEELKNLVLQMTTQKTTKKNK